MIDAPGATRTFFQSVNKAGTAHRTRAKSGTFHYELAGLSEEAQKTVPQTSGFNAPQIR